MSADNILITIFKVFFSVLKVNRHFQRARRSPWRTAINPINDYRAKSAFGSNADNGSSIGFIIFYIVIFIIIAILSLLLLGALIT